MKTSTHLLSLLLTIALLLGIAPTAHTVEPPDTVVITGVDSDPVSEAGGELGEPSSEQTAIEPAKPWRDVLSIPSAVDPKANQGKSVVSQSSTGLWQTETVDEGDVSWWSHFLVQDSAGRPHISYSNSDSIKYAWHDGTAWQVETVRSSENIYSTPVLAMDRSDRPHIIYCTMICGALACSVDLWYAWHDGTRWYNEDVSDSSVLEAGVLALDETGHPHIIYWGYDLVYARHDGTAWHIEALDTQGDGAASLALDGANRPHISYNSNGALKYAWHDGTAWHIETVDSGGGEGTLVLDEADHPHISYHNDGLKYAHHDGTAWHIETVDTTGNGVGTLILVPHHKSFDKLLPVVNWNQVYGTGGENEQDIRDRSYPRRASIAVETH